jgi:DNA-binding winged helix-turn-helix (wHTH) protein
VTRYRFSAFTLSPRRRLLVRDGREVPLIPRYFDLLLLLIERRHEAVHRREIFERVWADGIVSESALSQAVRTIRRTLGDDSREPLFIRTVSRHGYRFVFPDVIEEADDAPWPTGSPTATDEPTIQPEASPDEAPPVPPGVVDGRWTGRRSRRNAGRWAARAAGGGAVAGMAAGGAGGLILAAAPDSFAPVAIAPVLAVIGGGCGALGAAGVGAGLALAQAVRSMRTMVLVLGAAAGGGLVGAAVQWLTHWALAALVGLELDVGGGLEGFVIGAGAGLGFAIATRCTDDLPSAPRGLTRAQSAFIIALCCGMAGLGLTLTGHPLAGGTIHAIADAADGSRVSLAPLGRLIGEPDFGPTSRLILAFGESAVFGLGLAFGLIRRSKGEDQAFSP